ncbi:hypothetical protein CC86DRAFT_295670 [Ophiobolus disseminans]|uniref:Zn(2)-C6 fungal-type domain-containing protein n=1 Tax=Ophiobolus disseminans TaxID=1469910 RepID=A0A6A6ZVV4_9PLEO|nr:hypothetical protein CC86DRAFT_295670 [Ophiobolus disseminans]
MSARNPNKNPAHDGSRIDARRQHDDDDENDDSVARKRKRNLRKGTHSCWACKRRKEKCTFGDNSDVCTGCLRRGTRCVSQRFADNEAAQATAVTRTRLQHIEDMVAQLASQTQSQSQRQTGPPTSAPPIAVAETSTGSSQTALPLGLAVTPLPTSFCSDGSKTLSQTLHASLPCPQDIQLLRQATARQPVLSAIHITSSYATLRRNGIQPTDGVLSEPPPVTAEPILVARYMLQLVVFLQEMICTIYPELSSLVEPAAALMERCATAAISLVTRQDDLLGSVESLEAVILESIYQCNSGRLRLSWMAVQRAIRLAQSMGLHLSRTGSGSDSSGHKRDLPNLWFRMVHYNLQLSRMLGLPPGVADVTKSTAPSLHDMAMETPEAYLEQVYSHVMNLALAHSSSDLSCPPDVEATQAMEYELQRAANSAPSHWWLAPNLSESAKSSVTLFWDMRRLMIQMLHHDLRTQINVPHMLARGDGDRQRSEMARIACAHSSREVLSRFVLLRDVNQSVFSCRFANFLALMAAITLVLAHIGGSSYRSHAQTQDEFSLQVDSLLSHQAPSDRAMMEQALETMRSVGHSSGDTLSAQSADVLHRLLEIQAKNNLRVTEDRVYVSVQAQTDSQTATAAAASASASASATEEGERIFIPYFGLLRILRPNLNNAAHDVTETAMWDPRAGTELASSQGRGGVDQFDPVLLDVRDEHWMSQIIDMNFLDAFLDGTS